MTDLSKLQVTYKVHGENDIVLVVDDEPSMKVTYAGTADSFNNSKLVDEIVATVPKARCEADSDGSRVSVYVPVETNVKLLESVIVAHDSSVLSDSQIRAQVFEESAQYLKNIDLSTVAQATDVEVRAILAQVLAYMQWGMS